MSEALVIGETCGQREGEPGTLCFVLCVFQAGRPECATDLLL